MVLLYSKNLLQRRCSNHYQMSHTCYSPYRTSLQYLVVSIQGPEEGTKRSDIVLFGCVVLSLLWVLRLLPVMSVTTRVAKWCAPQGKISRMCHTLSDFVYFSFCQETYEDLQKLVYVYLRPTAISAPQGVKPKGQKNKILFGLTKMFLRTLVLLIIAVTRPISILVTKPNTFLWFPGKRPVYML